MKVVVGVFGDGFVSFSRGVVPGEGVESPVFPGEGQISTMNEGDIPTGCQC